MVVFSSGQFLRDAAAPFRWRQIRPAQAGRDEILAIITNHAEKRVIGFQNAALELPYENADDIGIDQAADLRFPGREVAIQAGVLQGDRRLRRDQPQHRRSGPA